MGCGASADDGPKKGEGTPYLDQYFDELAKFADGEVTQALNDPDALVDTLLDLQKEEKYMAGVKERTEAFTKQTQGLLSQSFDHHDIKGDGVLSKEESAKLFENFVNGKSESDKKLVKSSGNKVFKAQIAAIIAEAKKDGDAAYASKVTAEDRKRMSDNFKMSRARLDTQMKAAVEAYRKDKKNRDAAAFAVLDVSKEGSINKKEFLAAFEEESEKHSEFMAALGFEITLSGVLEAAIDDVKPEN